MKYFIASDIHGSSYYCRRMLDAFTAENADAILLLGDLLYHGPRNDLPRDYDTKAVIAMLNPYKDRIRCVRGNCDAEVDQWVLEFPMMDEYAVVQMDEKTVHLTHGHRDNPPQLQVGEIVLCGHTHVPHWETVDGVLWLNPGSVSIPKENSAHSYMTYEAGEFVWKSLDDGTVIHSCRIRGK